jgi:hypothetical protein
MKRITNNDSVDHIWVGQRIKPSEFYDIQPVEETQWVNDQQLRDDINAGLASVSDGGKGIIIDKTASFNFLKGTKKFVYDFLTSVDVTTTTFINLGDCVWNSTRNASYVNGTLIFYISDLKASITFTVRIMDITNKIVLGETDVTDVGFYTLSFDNPTTDAIIELQSKISDVANGTIKAASMEWEIQ